MPQTLRIAWDYGEDYFAAHPGNTSRFWIKITEGNSAWRIAVIGKVKDELNQVQNLFLTDHSISSRQVWI